jgi:hypothetical protein
MNDVSFFSKTWHNGGRSLSNQQKDSALVVPSTLLVFLPFVLYAETHYRFRYFFSYLKKSEPELIADIPHFVEPKKPIPLLLLCKDAHQYPCTLISVLVTAKQSSKVIYQRQILPSPVELKQHYWWDVFNVQVKNVQGWVEIDVLFEIEIHGKRIQYKNDNHRTSSHLPLRVYLARDPLPHFNGLSIGDCHTHSTATDDQVEFGAPLQASVKLCKSMGLDFFAVTDHSYDLDDRLDNYLVNDPSIPKWSDLQREIKKVNKSENRFRVVRGEEVSCRNSLGQNIHLLVLGLDKFVAGSGDSAERWLKTRSELSLAEILAEKEPNAVAIAAHPREKVSFIQRVLLGRGQWGGADLNSGGLHGIQFANGSRDPGFDEGYKAWVAALLRGKRLIAFGGNDAHGNFNRFRQIGIPFLLIRESDNQLFGRVRTGVFVHGAATEQSFLENIRRGKVIVSDGPLVNIRLSGRKSLTSIGSRFNGGEIRLTVSAKSSRDFGRLETIRLYIGKIGQKAESVFREERCGDLLSIQLRIRMTVKEQCYLRAEVYTDQSSSYDGLSHFALSNPVWFMPSSDRTF